MRHSLKDINPNKQFPQPNVLLKPNQTYFIASIYSEMRLTAPILLAISCIAGKSRAFVPAPFLKHHSVALPAVVEKKATTKICAMKELEGAAERLGKADVVASIASKTGLSKINSEAALSALLDTIAEEVASGKTVSLIGFGTFKLTQRAARLGRNPRTGEPLQIAASASPSFKAGKPFKEKCNA